MSRHTVSIRHVRVGDIELCTVECHPDELVERLRGMGLGRVEFRSMSGRDDRLLRGTPRGAQTAVQKSAARQASDRALMGDFRPEVPALEIVVYNDNSEFGKARQVYQFAGVASSAGYNIVPLPTGEGFGDDGSPSRPDGLDEAVEIVAQREGDGGAGLVPEALGEDGGDGSVPADLGRSEPAAGLGWRRIPQALLDGLQLIFTSPRHALLFLTAWAVFGFPAMVSRRRRLLADARSA
jgi:hypothetical protein